MDKGSGNSCNASRLTFINVDPLSNPKNQDTKKLVRSSATRHQWTRWRTGKEAKQKHVAQTGDEVAEASNKSNSPPCTVSPCGKRFFDHGQTLVIQIKGSLIDPFQSYPSDLPRELVNWCVKYNMYYVIPNLTCNEEAGSVPAIMRASLHHPALFHALMVGASVHRHNLLGLFDDAGHAEILRCKAEAFRHVRLAMQDLSGAGLDEMIHAIHVLSNNGSGPRRAAPALPETVQLPSQGPLKHLQFLNTRSSPIVVQEHYNALKQLVALRGGLESVQLFGVGVTVSYSGLRIASRDLTTPPFPFISLSLPSGPHEATFIAHGRRKQSRTSANLGKGFDTLAQFPDCSDILPVMRLMCDYVTFVDDYCAGDLSATEAVLIDHRNFTQHSLLSLPPSSQLDLIRGDGHLRESCRLAAIIFSFLVTFPMPYTTAPFARLASQLKTVLSSEMEKQGYEKLQILLWINTMGAIAALNTNIWHEFVSSVFSIAHQLGVHSWQEHKDILQRYLWYKYTNDVDGMDIWNEISSST